MALRQTLERIRIYAHLRRDENLANSEALARYERSVAIAIEAGEALAFVEPELLGLPRPAIRRACAPIHSSSILPAHARRSRAAAATRPLARGRADSGPGRRRGPRAVRRLHRPRQRRPDVWPGARRDRQRDRADEGAARAAAAVEGPGDASPILTRRSRGPISITGTRWRRCTARRCAATSSAPACATTPRPGKRRSSTTTCRPRSTTP